MFTDNSSIILFSLGLGIAGFVCVYYQKSASSWGSASNVDSTFINSSPQLERGQADIAVESLNFYELVMSYSGSIIADPAIALIPACKLLSILTFFKCSFWVCSYFVSAVSVDPVTAYHAFSDGALLASINWLSGTIYEFFCGTSIPRHIQYPPPPQNRVFRDIQSEEENPVFQLGSGDTPNPFGEGIEFTNHNISMLGLDPSPQEQEEEIFDFLV
jgi:hypothetical protein